MLGSAAVQLQTELAARIYRDCLDLKSGGGFQHFVGPPRPVDSCMGCNFLAACLAQLCDYFGDALGLGPGHDQDRIASGDNHKVLDPNRRYDRRDTAQVGILDVPRHHVARQEISLGVLVGQLPHCVPRPHIAPTGVHCHDRGVAGVLHDRVVDGKGFGPGESVRVHAHEIQVGSTLVPSRAAGFQHRRLQASEFRQIVPGRDQKQAAVPQIATFGEVFRSLGPVRFFDEGLNPVTPQSIRQRTALADVPIAGLRPRWHDAEHDHGVFRRGHGHVDGVVEALWLLDDVVRG